MVIKYRHNKKTGNIPQFNTFFELSVAIIVPSLHRKYMFEIIYLNRQKEVTLYMPKQLKLNFIQTDITVDLSI